MKSKSSGRRVVNSRLHVDPVDIAALFLEENVPQDKLLRDDLNRVVRLFSGGEFGRCKEILERYGRAFALHERDFCISRQLGALLMKIEEPRPDLAPLALQQFLEIEREMGQVNRRLGLDRTMRHVPESFRAKLLNARNRLRAALPVLSESVTKQILLLARPGPGMSIGTLNQYRTSAAWKYCATKPVSTPGALGLSKWLLASSPLWRRGLADFGLTSEPNTQLHNTVTFVPKNVTSLRTIAIEPSCNVMLQLGVHEYLSKILYGLRQGIGHDQFHVDGQARNAFFSGVGSSDGSLGTIDLSAASDSISIALVYQLLPLDWVNFLSLLRCTHGRLPDGRVIEFEKFSSMGNGFTFALETLVFWALAKACTDGTVSVYGDDIILPVQDVEPLVALLQYVGLRTNMAKSFWEGPFRESCGSDWYQGKFVTPLYWRASRRPLHSEVYSFINRLPVRWQWGKVREYLLGLLTERKFGPATLADDSCIHAPETYLRGIKQRRYNVTLGCYEYQVIQFVPASDRMDRTPAAALTALACGTRISDFALRGVGSYRYVWVPRS